MATVFLARLSGVGGFQRFVAIKRLHPHLANDQDFVQMFLDEARLAARLHHPNVVPILEIGTSDQGYYLVMEYVEGDTLARILARSAQTGRMIAPQVSMRVCLDTLAGLHAAHELKDDDGQPLNIVHRDVSPQNILIGMDGSARITDFGVARAATRLSTTRTGQLKGKLAYMAPEQARGAEVDRRADIFAMGIVVWECLALRRLFKGEGEADTLNRVLYEPIPSVHGANPDVPEALDRVVMKALDRDPANRYPTASDFADALEQVLRELKLMGSHREVATHLESVLGTDISAQRDAVRAWLARSEPSQRFEPRMLDTTKAEGAPGVSSVSSAVIAVPGAPRSSTPSTPATLVQEAPKKRARLWIAGAAACVLLGVVGVAAFARNGSTTKTAVTPPTTPTPPTSVAATTPTTTPTTPAITVETAVPSTAPTHTHVAAGSKTAGGSTVHVGVRPTTTATATAPPTATATTAPTVDDISKNPYR